MSYTNETLNYHLPQWVGSDKPTWLVDLNGAFSAIDTGMATTQSQADATDLVVSGHTTAITALQGTTSDQGTAITGLRTDVDHNTGDISTINSLIGNGTPTTTDKTIIGAINELDGEVKDLSAGRKYIFIGDSYALSASSDWIDKTAQCMGLTENVDYYDGHVSGVGFLRRADGTLGNGYLEDALKGLDSTISDKTSITDIVVLGGANDILSAISGDVFAAMRAFCNYVKTNYPNAKIGLGFIARYKVNGTLRTKAKFYSVMENYHQIGANSNAYYMSNIEDIMHTLSTQIDGSEHPDTTCGDWLAVFVSNFLHGGSCGVFYRHGATTNGIQYQATWKDAICRLEVDDLPAPTLGSTISGAGMTAAMTKIADFPDLYLNEQVFVPIHCLNDGKLYNGWLMLLAGEAYVAFENYDADNVAASLTVASDFAWKITYTARLEFPSYLIA